MKAVRDDLSSMFDRAPLPIRTYLRHLAGAQGKLLRAQALLIASMDAADTVQVDAVRLAEAIEIFHLATLVHDDVIDDAEIRRGIPSLQKAFGRKIAVICGDYLLAMALRIVAQVASSDKYQDRERPTRFPDYVSRICLGELEQYIHNRDFKLSVWRYLRIIRGKTAVLFEAAFRFGALASDEVGLPHQDYANFGRFLGMCFQITDDIIDYECDQETAKKPVAGDFSEGVVTLPLILSLQGSGVDAAQLTSESAVRLVRERGGAKRARGVSTNYYGKAKRILDSMNMSDKKREQMLNLLERAYLGPKSNGVR
ncbi:MAG: polyprenyl synthetase family protein [Bacillota bacterium]|nr:polyprenyl synthetase family protein [Bacillota bacterium]